MAYLASESPAPASDAKSRIRVVHVVETMALGGMERMIATLATTTDKNRFSVEVLCLKDAGAVADALVVAGIDVHVAGVPKHPPEYLPFRRIARSLKALSPDVVHTHNTPGLVYGAVSAWMARVPTVVHTEHGRQFPDRLRYVAAERVASEAVWRVVGVSNNITAALHRHVRIPHRKLRTVPNGVLSPFAPSQQSLSAARAELGIRETNTVVGIAARLVWEKGIKFLLEAWPSIAASVPSAVLLIVGDGPERDALQAQSTHLNIQDSVRFAGQRMDATDLMHMFDVCVMPSVSEGLPLALLEGMSVSRPIVATTVGGMPQALADGEAGILVPPRNPEALATAIVRMLSQPAEARALGVRARARFERYYEAHAMAAAYEAMYERKDDSAWVEPR